MCSKGASTVGTSASDCVNIQDGGSPLFTYSRERLIALRGRSLPGTQHVIDTKEALSHFGDKTILPRKRGRKGGVLSRLRKRYSRPPLPSIVLCNAHSLNNKMDELRVLCRYDSIYREACLLAFSETWFSDTNTDAETAIEGFSVVRGDRSRTESGKEGGGSVCAYINNRWCTDVTVHERTCTPLYDFLSISLRPFYLPREFSKLVVCVAYVPLYVPSEKTKTVASAISASVSALQSQYPDAPVLIMGDLNACTLVSELPSLQQYVTCPTRGRKIIDVCYGSIPNAYSCQPLPQLGRSDHSTVHLMPKYKQRLKREKPRFITARPWSADNLEVLRGCFDCTEWSCLYDPAEDINTNLDVITDYIKFCLDTVIPPRKKKLFPNTKPWFTPDIYNLLKQKRLAFGEGNTTRVAELHREVRSAVRQAKRNFKQKVEDEFSQMNTRAAFQHLKTMTDSGNSTCPRQPSVLDPLTFATDLNNFYNRFDKADYSAECARLMSDAPHVEGSVIISEEEVRTQLRRVKPTKAAGPDGLPARLLHSCADSLAAAFHPLFQTSVDTGVIPTLWKSSLIIPVPKKPKAKELNNFRPIALTPLPMKCLEKILLKNLLPFVEPHLDPLQFAYRAGRGVEDAVATLLHRLLEHLETPGHYARILFADFSSAFNTMQRHVLVEKLQQLEVPTAIVRWVLDFLSDRRQRVRVGDVLSPESTTNTGAPQGCVLSPFLYITYTNDCRCQSDACSCVKFADDSAILGLISDAKSQQVYQQAVDRFSEWCSDHHLELNVSKTRELVVDPRRGATPVDPVIIGQDTVEVVQSFRYLGLTLDSSLSFKDHVAATQRKCQQRLYVLRRLRSFELAPKLLLNLYRSIIEPLLTYCSIVYLPSLSVTEKNKLYKVSNTASKIIGLPVPSISAINDKTLLRKARAVSGDTSHPLNPEFELLPSGRRYRTSKGRKVKFRSSFVPSAIKRLNAMSSPRQ